MNDLSSHPVKPSSKENKENDSSASNEGQSAEN
jgi:hypothetical protein